MPIKLIGEHPHERFTEIPSDNETRMCLDPWSKVFIKIDGSVALCCNAPPIGSLKDQTLQQILDNDEAKKYRKGLLIADLPYHCKVCPDRCTTTPQKLEETLMKYLEGNTDLIDRMESI